MLSRDDFLVGALTDEGLLSGADRERSRRYAAEHGVELGEALVACGVIGARDLALVRASASETPFVDLAHFDIDVQNAGLVPRSVAEKHRVFPLFVLGKSVTVGMADPLDLSGLDRVRSLLKAEVEPVLCEWASLKALIERAYSLQGIGARPESAPETPGQSGEEPIVAAVNQILAQAVEEGASDVHLAPDERELHIRYRIDGSLRNRRGPSLASHPGLVQRVKVMANLDLTQSRRPQDGKFRFTHAGRAVDVRVSIVPTVCGENVVLRLLSGVLAASDFGALGMPADVGSALTAGLDEAQGMILATGPTGSGKTTTLYTAMKRVSTPEVHCVAIEDPVEIRLPLVRHVQVNTEIGLTFAGALRSIMRQDPDVILVGEVRDEETARIAVQAALTGHMVLSTLHTNDAPGAVARLRDLGCAGFAVSAAVLAVVGQRLIRRVCVDCAAPYQPDAALLRRFGGVDAGQARRGKGCARCAHTGFAGRIGVYELMRVGPAVRAGIEEGCSTEGIRKIALGEGMRPMWRDGLEKARVGMTTIEEVGRLAAASLDGDLAAGRRAAA